MYPIVLAALLATGDAAPAADIYEDVRDLKKMVEELKKDQTQFRTEALKMMIAGLQHRLLDEKIDEVRRDLLDLRIGRMGFAWAPAAPFSQRARLTLQVPAGASLVVNDQEIALPSPNPEFITPPLEPGRDYYYDCKVTVVRDGKAVTRTKRVTVRAGATTRLNYEEMEGR
jgi:uncharacterized protein (TIGR03000 family)